MPTDVLMPQLSPTMTEGRFAKWVKKEGDAVRVGDIIAEIETDKATMEVEATEDGILAKLYAEAGKDIPVGAPIAVIVEEGEKLPKDYTPTSEVKTAEKEEAPQEEKKEAAPVEPPKVEIPQKEASQVAPVTVQTVTAQAEDTSERIKASPLARRLAAEFGIPLANITPTGPNGRIVRVDVENARAQGVRKTTGAAPQAAQGAKGTGAAAPKSALQPFAEPLQPQTVPHSKMRSVIAERLVAAKQNVPHFYLTVDVMMAEALKARASINALGGGAYKVSVNDMIIKASALALRQHPAANASWAPENMVHYGSADISVAVATKGGLITPIVKNAEDKDLVSISTEMKALAKKAQAGKLQPEEYQGGSFSVSNLGMYGIKHFDAIINPPQACILACGAAEKRPVVNAQGEVVAADVMTLTLSVDHRVVDGALGAELLGSIKTYLENPIALTLS